MPVKGGGRVAYPNKSDNVVSIAAEGMTFTVFPEQFFVYLGK